jgi:hypothetical protein
MNPRQPFLLFRARVQPNERDRFAQWFRGTHLRDVERIPGIAAVTSGRLQGGTHLGFYSFENGEAVQIALGSPEAAYARGTLEEWTQHMEELFIEIWAPLSPMPVFQSRS